MSISNQADFYLNFQQFGDMKLDARKGSDDAAKSVAQQFEGLFVQQMLAAMRSAVKIDTGQKGRGQQRSPHISLKERGV